LHFACTAASRREQQNQTARDKNFVLISELHLKSYPFTPLKRLLREQRSFGERTAFTVALMRFNIVATERMMPNRETDWRIDAN